MVAGSEFVRQTPRAALRASVRVTPADGGTALGRAVDISPAGISVRVSRRLRGGERVDVLLDLASLRAEVGDITLPPLFGSVSWVARDGEFEGLPMYRTGILFGELPDGVSRRLRELPGRLHATPEADADTLLNDESARAALAQSAAGRERLYQIALERLGACDFTGARTATRGSLAVIPHARHMRALLCRIEAEAALAGDQLDEARRRIGHGRRLMPDDPIWEFLDRQTTTRPRAKRSFWSRIFSR
jgi:hypothetical protein